MIKPLIFKIWIAVIIYVLALVVGLGFIFPDSHFPIWFELTLKGTALLGFLAIILGPLAYKLVRPRQKEQSSVLVVAGYATAIGYALLFSLLLYVKLETCDIDAIPHDYHWHCNVSGKGAVVYFVAIPILGAIVGMVVAGIGRVVQKRR